MLIYQKTMDTELETIIEKIADQDSRYKQDAYAFIMDALAYSQDKFNAPRHVSGQQLLEGAKELLIKSFGPMAINVLEHWGIRSTEDIGNIVFNLVKNNVLNKTEEDNINSFKDGYNFEEVFRHGYRKQLEKKISRMRSF